MDYQLDITLTEDDYLAFNVFHVYSTPHGKAQMLRTRLIFVGIMCILAAVLVAQQGWTTFTTTYIILLTLFTAIYILQLKKVVTKNIKRQIRRLNSQGKLPFDPAARYEFYEDKLVDIGTTKRTEQGYGVFEHIYVFNDKYLYIYESSVAAHILPISQVKEQVNWEEFLDFLSQKCGEIIYC